jgi:hypothetical protein
MRALEKRISHLENTPRLSRAEKHWVPDLFYPWELPNDMRETWLAEQIRCDCSPACPGKRIGAILPKKAPSAEAWAAQAQAYYAKRRGSHA